MTRVCFGISFCIRRHADVEGKVFAAQIHADIARTAACDVDGLKIGAGGLKHRDQSNIATGPVSLALNFADKLIHEFQVPGAVHFRHEQRFGTRFHSGFHVFDHMAERTIDADRCIGAGLGDGGNGVRQHIACSCPFRFRHAVFQVQNDRIGGTGVCFSNKAFAICRYVKQ